MPLDVLGRTRATLMHSTSLSLAERLGQSLKLHRDGDRLLQLLVFNGMPSKRNSSDCVDYAPALCTHRPSLLPIGCAGEVFGLAVEGGNTVDCREVH